LAKHTFTRTLGKMGREVNKKPAFTTEQSITHVTFLRHLLEELLIVAILAIYHQQLNYQVAGPGHISFL
jgi:hypothetical protein